MKHCPECDSSFPDTDKFCEFDGAQLVADDSDSDPDLSVPAADQDPDPDSPPEVEGADSNPNLLVPPADPDPEPGSPPESDSESDLLVPPADQDPESGSPPESDSEPDLLVPPADQDPEPYSQPELMDAGGYQDSSDERLGQNWKTLAIVAVAGVAIGVILFVVYQRMTRESPVQSTNVSSNDAVTQQPMPPLPLLSSPTASASPSVEPSPSPRARPTPAAPAESPRVALSSSPVSTGGSDRRGPVTIRLTDGTSVVAEEVWETGEGIWYRRRGLVTLLKRNQIKSIDKPPTARPSPAPTTTASPSKSP